MVNGAGGSSDFVGNLAVEMNNSEEETPETAANPLVRLVEGEQVFMKINPKSMLLYIMDNLGSNTEPVFTEIDCGNNFVKISIKLDVSDLRTVSQERIIYSVVEGDVSSNFDVAEASAVMKAFTILEEKHKIGITDFSSRMIVRYKSSGIYGLVCEGIDLLQKLVSEWEATLQHSEDIAVKLMSNQFSGTVGGKLSNSGKMYALVGDDLCYNISLLKVTSDESRSALNELQSDHKHYENLWGHIGKMTHMNGFFHEVDFTTKEMLEFAMQYFGLSEPKFSNGPDSNGMAESTVIMKFPEMRKHQFSGNIKLSAKAYSSIEATEEASLEALAFIEKQFLVKIIDFNYLKRKETFKQLTDLLGYLSRIFHVVSTVRTMWSKLDMVIECNAGLFKFDPLAIFPGEVGQSQIEAYNFCFNNLVSVKQYSSERFASAAIHVEALDKLSWKLFVLKNKFGV